MTETALTAVIEEAHIQDISTRAVDDLIQALAPGFAGRVRKTIDQSRTWNGFHMTVTVHSRLLRRDAMVSAMRHLKGQVIEDAHDARSLR